MANSGICDHLRGGFYRYATDVQWFAPHFEKMLYDNAQMLSLYSRAYCITKAPVYKDVAQNIIAFAERELKKPGGGYCAALDADSEGIEGRFYVFTTNEIQETLSTTELELATLVYNFKPGGNWEHGFNILHKTHSPAQILDQSGLSVAEFHQTLSSVNSKLRALQDQRIRPGLDDKVICSWNGLWLKALADAGRYLSEPRWTQMAQEQAVWMLKNLKKSGQLTRTHYKSGNVLPAYSEDYACFIEGLIALYEADGNNDWLNEATILADTVIADFYNPENSLFAFTRLNQQALILHKYDTHDDVIPSSNAVLCVQLQKLGILAGRNDFYQTGKEMLRNLRSQVMGQAEWHCNWAKAAQAEAIGLLQVAFTGSEKELLSKSIAPLLPSWAVQAIESENPSEFIRHKTGSKSQVFICVNETCLEPVDSVHQVEEILADLLANP
jgi:uncharacterized protein YyaL (SSP411 family)